MKKFSDVFKLMVNVTGSTDFNLECHLDMEHNIDKEIELIGFRKNFVKVRITQEVEPENKKNIVIIQDTFKVKEVKFKYFSKNVDRLSLILIQKYEKEKEIEMVKLRLDNVIIDLELIPEDLYKQNEMEEGLEE